MQTITCFRITHAAFLLYLSVLTSVLHQPVEIWEMIRMIATARIVMPKAMVRLSAGRVRFSMPEQALCFLAGANSIFAGEKLLTTANNDFNADQAMFKILGLIPKAPSFGDEEAVAPAEAERPEQAASM